MATILRISILVASLSLVLPAARAEYAYVLNSKDDDISLIDTKTYVVESFPVPGGPDDMELRKDGTELWVTSRWINRVSVIDLKSRKLKHSIKVGRSPHGLYFHAHAPRI